jgi:hypothetical protein
MFRPSPPGKVIGWRHLVPDDDNLEWLDLWPPFKTWDQQMADEERQKKAWKKHVENLMAAEHFKIKEARNVHRQKQ